MAIASAAATARELCLAPLLRDVPASLQLRGGPRPHIASRRAATATLRISPSRENISLCPSWRSHAWQCPLHACWHEPRLACGCPMALGGQPRPGLGRGGRGQGPLLGADDAYLAVRAALLHEVVYADGHSCQSVICRFVGMAPTVLSGKRAQRVAPGCQQHA